MRSRRGATLVEVMASIAIFSVALVSLLSVLVSNVKMAKQSDYAYIAYNLAKNHLETLRAMNFTDLSAAAESATVLDDEGVPDPDGTFTRSTTVTTPYNADAKLAKVTVSVLYTINGTDSADPMKMSTVIYNG